MGKKQVAHVKNSVQYYRLQPCGTRGRNTIAQPVYVADLSSGKVITMFIVDSIIWLTVRKNSTPCRDWIDSCELSISP